MNAELNGRAAGTLRISVRESRMMVERVLLQTRWPSGCIPAVRDAILTSQAMRLGGYSLLVNGFDALCAVPPGPLAARDTAPGEIEVDAGGRHAWLVAASLLELGVDAAHGANGRARISVRDVRAAPELAVTEALAYRYGASARVACDGPNATLEVTLRENARSDPSFADWDPLLWRFVQEGLEMPAALWWAVYDRALDALAPDTVESRRHAGPIILAADGSVIGRTPDDDTDFTLLGRAGNATGH